MNKRASAKSSSEATTGPQTPQVRARLWIQIASTTALTEPGADLLEQIAAHGSLSEAARRLHYSYRRAWMLLDAMNRAWQFPVVTTATGGKKGGGAQLTEFGHALISAYRNLQLELEHFLDHSTPPFLRSLR